jgi:hypothetical protein
MLYYCPVCKKQENFDSPLELKRHIASLRNNGVPFTFPFICVPTFWLVLMLWIWLYHEAVFKTLHNFSKNVLEAVPFL